MGYRIRRSEGVLEAVRRVAREELAKAREELRDPDRHEAVHAARQRGKKLRALVRLVRPCMEATYADANARLRDAARGLSELRDATSRIESLDALRARYAEPGEAPSWPSDLPFEQDGGEQDAWERVRAGLVRRRDELARELDLEARLARFDAVCAALEAEVDGWSFEETGARAVRAGLRKTYARARRALDAVREDPTTENLHEWRKRVKDQRYQLRLLRGAWPDVIGGWRKSARRLSDLQGDDHDLALLRAALREDPELAPAPERRALDALAGMRRAELQARMLPIGARLHREKPKRWARRIGRYLEAWRREQALDETLPPEAGRTT